MFSAFFSAFSGMLGFSRGLDVIGNNVANLNTPGFKATELQFRDLFYRYGPGGTSTQVGQGLDTGSTRTRYGQGELRETGNQLDLSVDGLGFFVLRKDGEVYYTRTGQFEFNEDDILVERGSQARVAALNGTQLSDISLAGLRVSAPRPTTEVTFVGNLSTGSSSHELTDVTVFDGAGTARRLTIELTNNNATVSRSWLVEVREGSAVVATGEIRYQGSGAPAAGFNRVAFVYAPPGTAPTAISLNFGEPGSFSASTGFSAGTTSDLRVDTQNGFPVGSLIGSTFDAGGALTLRYSNGQTGTHERLALAWFGDLQALTLTGGTLFQAPPDRQPTMATAGESGMGTIAGGSIELSNVELTEQFTDIVVVQRGFQASSQVLSVANEMAQQLLDLRARR